MACPNITDNDGGDLKLETEQNAVATTYIFLSLVFSVVYVFALLAIIRDEEMYANACYKLMFWLGASDLLNCILFGLLTGAMMLIGKASFGYQFCKIVGATTQFLWMTSVVMAAVLSLNRCLAIWSRHIYERAFDGIMIYFWLALCGIFGLVNLVMFLQPEVDFIFYFTDTYTWYYGCSVPTAVKRFELTRDAVVMIAMVVCYILIGLRLRLILAKSSKRDASKQMQVLAAPFSITALLVAETVYFFIVPTISNIPPLVVMLAQIWNIVATGMNGIFYIAFNRSIRQNVWRFVLCCFKFKGTVAPLVTTANLKVDGRTRASIAQKRQEIFVL